jgi:putative RecB family exonuclease
MGGMSFAVPTSMSPSRVEAFVSCPLAFRFASIEKLPEPPSPHTTKGSLVHRSLELLFTRPPGERTREAARAAHESARREYEDDREFTQLGLADTEAEAFFADAWSLVEGYLAMEDPATIHEIGLELKLEATVQVSDQARDGAEAAHLTLRGIIDRLELDADGGLIVTDYKTGKAPGLRYEQNSLAGLNFYSFLCEEVFGRRPAAIRLMYLRSRETITATPSAQSVKFVRTRTKAVWQAVGKACAASDFRPKPGGLCAGCAFRPWCPEFGGDPALAAAEAPVRYGMSPAA